MNETLTLDILDSLDAIQESAMDASINVMDALICEYEKISCNIANSEESVIMEGQVWDTATGKGKVESDLYKIIMFLPRLLKGIVKAIGSVFTKENQTALTNNMSSLQNNIDKYTETELAQRSQAFNQQTNGEVKFDPKKKQFFLGRMFRHIKNSVLIVIGLVPLFKKALILLNGGKSEYSTIVNELKEVIKGNKKLDSETAYLSIEAAIKLAGDGWGAAAGIRGVTDELSMIIEKRLRKKYKKGQPITGDDLKLKELLDQISEGSKHIASVTSFCKIMAIGTKVFAGPIKRWHDKHVKVYPEDIELNDEGLTKDELEDRLKGLKEEYKTIKNSKKVKDKKRAEILNLEKEIKRMEKLVKKSRSKRDVTKEIDEESDKMWRDTDASGNKKHEFNPISAKSI